MSAGDVDPWSSGVGIGVARSPADELATEVEAHPASPPAKPRSRRLWNEAAVRAGEACDSALAQVGEDRTSGTGPRPWAIVVVTGSGGEGEFLRQFEGLCELGPRGVRPSTAPRSGLNSVAAELSIELEAEGPNLSLSGHLALGHAFSWAARHLASGEAALSLVVAVEEVEAESGRDATAVAISLRPEHHGLVDWDPRTGRLWLRGPLAAGGAVEVDLGKPGSGPGALRTVDHALTIAEAARDVLVPGTR